MKRIQPMQTIYIYDSFSSVIDSLVWLLESYGFVCQRMDNVERFITHLKHHCQAICIANEVDLPEDHSTLLAQGQWLILLSPASTLPEQLTQDNLHWLCGPRVHNKLVDVLQQLISYEKRG